MHFCMQTTVCQARLDQIRRVPRSRVNSAPKREKDPKIATILSTLLIDSVLWLRCEAERIRHFMLACVARMHAGRASQRDGSCNDA
jgi:hypothetical protein